MKNRTEQHANPAPGISAVILGGLITLGLFFLRYFKILHLNLEVVLAPIIVATLLAYGDKLLAVLFLLPISFFSKAIRRLK